MLTAVAKAATWAVSATVNTLATCEWVKRNGA